MSACVSSHGEYSEHATNEDLWCSRCYQYDTAAVDAAVIVLNMLRARDEAERALIEKWRGESDNLRAAALKHPAGSFSAATCTVLADAVRRRADELERAIGGGR